MSSSLARRAKVTEAAAAATAQQRVPKGKIVAFVHESPAAEKKEAAADKNPAKKKP